MAEGSAWRGSDQTGAVAHSRTGHLFVSSRAESHGVARSSRNEVLDLARRARLDLNSQTDGSDGVRRGSDGR